MVGSECGITWMDPEEIAKLGAWKLIFVPSKNVYKTYILSFYGERVAISSSWILLTCGVWSN